MALKRANEHLQMISNQNYNQLLIFFIRLIYDIRHTVKNSVVTLYGDRWLLIYHGDQFRSVQLSRSVVSNSLRPHESQHARPPCSSQSPRVQTHVHRVHDAIQPPQIFVFLMPAGIKFCH